MSRMLMAIALFIYAISLRDLVVVLMAIFFIVDVLMED